MGLVNPCCPKHGLFSRRRLLQAAVAGTAMGWQSAASAAEPPSIRQLTGTAWINGAEASPRSIIRAGDTIKTAVNGQMAFVHGRDAYLLRPSTELTLENSLGNQVVSGLRLVTGGLLAAFGRGPKQIRTASATIGIRGTGVYLEANPKDTYFCLCYGDVEVQASDGLPPRQLAAGYHLGKRIGQTIEDDGMLNHTDAELDLLEALQQRTPPFRKPKQVG